MVHLTERTETGLISESDQTVWPCIAAIAVYFVVRCCIIVSFRNMDIMIREALEVRVRFRVRASVYDKHIVNDQWVVRVMLVLLYFFFLFISEKMHHFVNFKMSNKTLKRHCLSQPKCMGYQWLQPWRCIIW